MLTPISSIIFECDDPYELASFWSQVTGYQEDSDDPNRPGDRAALLIAPDGSPDLLFIQVDEATDVVRLTLAVADLEAEIERMRGLGATITYGIDEDVAFSDPEGNEFRLVVGRTRKPALPRLTLDAPVQVRVTGVLTVDIPAGALRGLQALGDAMLAALSQGDEGARRVAPPLIAALREREWEGDDVLAGQLESMLATGAIPDLRPAPAKLDQIADVLEGDPMQGDGRLNLETGDVWPYDTYGMWGSDQKEEEEEEEEEEDKWLYVHCAGSRDGYRDMEVFIGTMRDAVRANELELAIQGRGAFRRFRETIQEWPGERERWDAFSVERQLGRARAWLDGAGYYVHIGVLASAEHDEPAE